VDNFFYHNNPFFVAAKKCHWHFRPASNNPRFVRLSVLRTYRPGGLRGRSQLSGDRWLGVWGICSDPSNKPSCCRNNSRGPVHFKQLRQWKWIDPFRVVPQRPTGSGFVIRRSEAASGVFAFFLIIKRRLFGSTKKEHLEHKKLRFKSELNRSSGYITDSSTRSPNANCCVTTSKSESFV
jgi:hypothetical protein